MGAEHPEPFSRPPTSHQLSSEGRTNPSSRCAIDKYVAGGDSTTGPTPGERSIVIDLFQLMKQRGVRYVYEGFRTADWWLLAAAADAATERVNPTVAEFARELTQQGASRGLVWGGNDAGVLAGERVDQGPGRKITVLVEGEGEPPDIAEVRDRAATLNGQLTISCGRVGFRVTLVLPVPIGA